MHLFELHHKQLALWLLVNVPEAFGGRKNLGPRLNKKPDRLLNASDDKVNSNGEEHARVCYQYTHTNTHIGTVICTKHKDNLHKP